MQCNMMLACLLIGFFSFCIEIQNAANHLYFSNFRSGELCLKHDYVLKMNLLSKRPLYFSDFLLLKQSLCVPDQTCVSIEFKLFHSFCPVSKRNFS